MDLLKNSSCKSIQILLSFQTTTCKSTPLHLAVQGTKPEVVELLIKNNADLTIENLDEKTPFELASNNVIRKTIMSSRQSHPKLPDDEGDLGNKCRICFDQSISTIILPCGHQAFCTECATKLEVCAFDRKPITQIVPVFNAGE